MKELLATNKVLFSAIGGLIGSIFGEVDGFWKMRCGLVYLSLRNCKHS